MKKSLFTIAFMTIMTIVFISILAFFNESTKDKIAQNMEIEKSKSILYAFDIFPGKIRETDLKPSATTNDIPWNEYDIIDSMKTHIRTVNVPVTTKQKELLKNSYVSVQDSVTIYARIDDYHEIIAYGFPLKGKGLWGTISAFASISADLNKLVGIDFTEQVETPGLGARILETEFKYFFRNLDLAGFHQETIDVPIMLVKKKDNTNIEQSTNSLQAITGATQTVDGVLKMMNTDLKFYINLLIQNEQFIKNRI